MGKTTGSPEASTSSFGNKYGSPRETRSSAMRCNGFSLVEIAIIMVIIGLIVGTVIPRLIKVVQQEAIKETKTDIQDSRDELIGYVLATGCIMPANTAACESIIAHRKDKWNNNFYCEIPAALESADVVNFNATTGMSVQVGSSAQEDEIAYLVGSKGRNGARDLGTVSPFLIQPYDESGYDDIVEYVSFSYLQSLCTTGGEDEDEIDLEEDIDDWEGAIAIDPDDPGGAAIGDFDGDGNLEISLFDNATTGEGNPFGGAACIWYPGTDSNCDSDGLCTFGSGLRIYYTLRVSTPSQGGNLEGMTFAVLGSGENRYGTTNASLICGDVGEANGYGADNQDEVSPFMLAPKVGVEFDWDGGNGALGDPDPNHLAILYWATYDKQKTEFKTDALCKHFNPKWTGLPDGSTEYDDVIHGYGAANEECDPLRVDRVGTFLGGYSADDLRLPNPAVGSSGHQSVPDGEVGSYPWMEDNTEHPVRIELHWNNATGQLTTTAWVGGSGLTNISDDLSDDLTVIDPGFTCTAPCYTVTDTVTVPEGLRAYFYKIRWGWTLGNWRDGALYIESPKKKYIP